MTKAKRIPNAQLRYLVNVYASTTASGHPVRVERQDRAVATKCVVAGWLVWDRPGSLRVLLSTGGEQLVEKLHALEPADLAKRVKLTEEQLRYLRILGTKGYASSSRTADRTFRTLTALRLATWARAVVSYEIAIEVTDRGRAYLAALDGYTELHVDD